MELANPFEIWEYHNNDSNIIVMTLDNGKDEFGHWNCHNTLILFNGNCNSYYYYVPGTCYRAWAISKDLGWKKLVD